MLSHMLVLNHLTSFMVSLDEKILKNYMSIVSCFQHPQIYNLSTVRFLLIYYSPMLYISVVSFLDTQIPDLVEPSKWSTNTLCPGYSFSLNTLIFEALVSKNNLVISFWFVCIVSKVFLPSIILQQRDFPNL